MIDGSRWAATTLVVPVFPLPHTVFFPRTLLPLHVFETRYRDMVRDAVAGDGLIAVALADGQLFRPIGTVGRISSRELLDDGRSNVVLEGLQRVRMVELSRDTAYRQVRAEPLPERAADLDEAGLDRAKLDLLATINMLRSLAQQEPHVTMIHERVPFDIVVNTACAGLPIGAELRQSLLEETDLVRRHQRVSAHLTAVLETLSQLCHVDGESDTLLN